MSRRDWADPTRRTLGMFLNGEEIPGPGPSGEPVLDDSFVVVLHAGPDALSFRLPARRFGNRWRLVIDTADPGIHEGARSWSAGASIELTPRSAVVVRRAW